MTTALVCCVCLVAMGVSKDERNYRVTSQCRLLLAPPAASDVDMGATRVN
jgi:hypothetical protein